MAAAAPLDDHDSDDDDDTTLVKKIFQSGSLSLLKFFMYLAFDHIVEHER